MTHYNVTVLAYGLSPRIPIFEEEEVGISKLSGLLTYLSVLMCDTRLVPASLFTKGENLWSRDSEIVITICDEVFP